MKKSLQGKLTSDKNLIEKDLTINIKKKLKKHKISEDYAVSPEKTKNKNDNQEITNINNIANSVSMTNIIKNENEKLKSPKCDKDNVISNTLNFNIPLRLKIEINRSEKCSKIIEYLKNLSELNLEQNDNYTEFVMLSKDNYIEQDMKIDDTFLNNQKISIYELLNNEGLKFIFDYNNVPQSNIVPLKNQKIEILNNNHPLQSSSTKTSKYKKNLTPRKMQDNKKKVKNNSIKMVDMNFIPSIFKSSYTNKF
jgi:hypothetical protein